MMGGSDWRAMKTRAFAAFQSNGRMRADDLEEIVAIGCRDGNFDDKEKQMLISIIANLTRADLDHAMWEKVAELIKKFELESDEEARIEALPDEDQP
ncbi:MAG: hypothetical protein PVF89_01500 [Lysobacterales bacterium]|jgi:hypothetical protein